jgi:hypothetical protein
LTHSGSETLADRLRQCGLARLIRDSAGFLRDYLRLFRPKADKITLCREAIVGRPFYGPPVNTLKLFKPTATVAVPRRKELNYK